MDEHTHDCDGMDDIMGDLYVFCVIEGCDYYVPADEWYAEQKAKAEKA